jgi:hypothetical protein
VCADYKEIKLRAACWKNKREVYILSNMHIPPADGSFEEGGKVVMSPVIRVYTVSIWGYVDLSDRMANSSSMSKISWNRTFVRLYHSKFIHCVQDL